MDEEQRATPVWAMDLRERMARVEQKLDQYNDIREAAYAAKNQADNCANDIGEIKGSLTWLWRTIAGAIIGVVTAAVVTLRGGN